MHAEQAAEEERYDGPGRPPQDDHARPARRLSGGLLAALALIACMGPFATDLHLAAFPEMMLGLGTGTTGVQLTLTGFFIGLGTGQVFFGILSDRLGRKGPLIAGATACLLASIACALAPGIGTLIAARFAQGFAGAAGPVIARAIISDLASGARAARAFSLLAAVVGIAPVIAPIIGGMLLDALGWRGLMWIITGLATAMLAVAVLIVPESHPRARRETVRAARSAQGPAWRALRSRAFTGHLLAFAFGFGALMSHVAASPFVFQVMAGFDERSYGLAFASIAGTMVACTWLSARLTRRVPPAKILRWGLRTLLSGALLLLLLTITGAPAIWLWPALVIAIGGIGLSAGNAMALALGAARHAAGTASACLGAAQFALGATVSPLVGAWGERTSLPLALTMLSCAVMAAAGAAFARRGRREAA